MECGNCLLRSCLLYKTQQRVQRHNDEDHQHIERNALVAVEDPRCERHSDGAEQEINQRIGELSGKLSPCRYGSASTETVRAVAFTT